MWRAIVSWTVPAVISAAVVWAAVVWAAVVWAAGSLVATELSVVIPESLAEQFRS